jgi:ATP-binding cassette subfamily F protein 3
MGFPEPTRSGDIVLRAERLAKAYDRPLFAGVDLEITRGQRWALLGPNGCGKTTLLRCLLELLAPDEGRVTLGTGVEVGYFDQQLAELDDEMPAVEVVRPRGAELNQQQRRDLLARFGLTGETALQSVRDLSGGERCRAALARLAAATANFLVLDEPTNHLDLWARDSLERSLRRFEGTVLFVSHDRYFVDRVADHLLVVEPDRIRTVEGNYQTYKRLVDAGAGKAGDRQPPETDPPRREQRSAEAEKPARVKRRFPYRKVADLEEEIFQRETRVEELQGLLAQGNTHRDGDRVRQIKAEITEQQAALGTLYEHWEEATELNW